MALVEAIAITEVVGKIRADETLGGAVVDDVGILVIMDSVLGVLYFFASLRKARNQYYQYQGIFICFPQR